MVPCAPVPAVSQPGSPPTQTLRVKGSTRGSCSVASFFPVHRHEVHMTLPVPAQLAHEPLSSVPQPTQVPQVR